MIPKKEIYESPWSLFFTRDALPFQGNTHSPIKVRSNVSPECAAHSSRQNEPSLSNLKILLTCSVANLCLLLHLECRDMNQKGACLSLLVSHSTNTALQTLQAKSGAVGGFYICGRLLLLPVK